MIGSTDSASGSWGAAYVFQGSGADWSHQATLGEDLGDIWMRNVAIDDETIVTTAFQHSTFTFQGHAQVFVPQPDAGVVECTCGSGPCSNDDPSAGCANSTGSGALLLAQGHVPSGEVNLLVSAAPPGQFGIFFQGNNLTSIPSGDGTLCTTQGLVRITPIAQETDDGGSTGYGPCFGDPSIPAVTGVVPGSGVTRRYQFYFRDPAGPCTSGFNTSNALAITW